MTVSRTARPARSIEPGRPATARTIVSAALSAALFAGPASADDTEVFFGQINNGENINPNVLFVLDTSGSMNYFDDGYEGTRADRLKDAMYQILRESDNLNVGLMRLNGAYGGRAR